MTDAGPMIRACMVHPVPWDAVERHAWLEDHGVWVRYADSGTLDTPHVAVDRDDQPPRDAYYPIVWAPSE